MLLGFFSVGVPFLFTFSIALHTAKGGQTFKMRALKFPMLQLNNLGIPHVHAMVECMSLRGATQSSPISSIQ